MCLHRNVFSCFCGLESEAGLIQLGHLVFDGLKLVVMDIPRLAHHKACQRLQSNILANIV